MPLGNIYLIAVRIQIKDTRKRMSAAAKDYKQLKCPSTDYSLNYLLPHAGILAMSHDFPEGYGEKQPHTEARSVEGH